jgi:hypothetical protein
MISGQDWEWFSDTWKGLFLALIFLAWTIYGLIFRT